MHRQSYLNIIDDYFRTHPIVAILGPRQCGKTTLARMYAEKEQFAPENYFDLEDSTDKARLQNPKLALEPLKNLIIIDEIQRLPDLFPTLRVMADRPERQQRYLILGSASRDLIQQSSESLAGRIAYLELTPFSYSETHQLDVLWERGGFPKSFLAPSLVDSITWREFYISTFLEQDIPNLGIQIPSMALRRFWSMLAHYHGNIFNASEIGRSLGVSDTTVRRYLDILSGTFMIRQLPPWRENLKKRQVSAPKVYFRDSGLLHSLLDVHSLSELQGNPKSGASWEGFALEEILRAHRAKPHEAYFWATHGGAELDLLLITKNQRLGFEFKYTDAPKLTKSMHISCQDLALDSLKVIYPGNFNFSLTEKIEAQSLRLYLDSLS